MDILRKMFKTDENEAEKDVHSDSTAKDEFRKPQWFEESETDDELFDDDRKFAFQMFTNPMELQKHFERQMKMIMDAINEMEDSPAAGAQVDKNLKEKYLKPGFENDVYAEFFKGKGKGSLDSDLDGEIYADQMHSLIQRLEPDDPMPNILPRNDRKPDSKFKIKERLTDEEIIFGRLHGTLGSKNEPRPRQQRQRIDIMSPIPRTMPSPFGNRGASGNGNGGVGVFEGTYQGPKLFSQSVMVKTIRKPDGSFETTKVTQDAQGNKTTTVTRSVGGKTETYTTYDGIAGSGTIKQRDGVENPEMQTFSDPNIAVTRSGYAVPRNLW